MLASVPILRKAFPAKRGRLGREGAVCSRGGGRTDLEGYCRDQ